MALTEIKKTIINVLTVVVTAGPWILHALNVFPGGAQAAAVVSAVLGVAGVLLHYFVPNTTTDPSVAAHESVVLKPATRAKRKDVARKTDSGHKQTY